MSSADDRRARRLAIYGSERALAAAEASVKRLVDEAPPLTDMQRHQLAMLLRPRTALNPDATRITMRLHYDKDDTLLCVDDDGGSLTASIRRRFVTRTERVTHVGHADADRARREADQEALFGPRMGEAATRYLAERGAWDLLTPIVVANGDGAPMWWAGRR